MNTGPAHETASAEPLARLIAETQRAMPHFAVLQRPTVDRLIRRARAYLLSADYIRNDDETLMHIERLQRTLDAWASNRNADII